MVSAVVANETLPVLLLCRHHGAMIVVGMLTVGEGVRDGCSRTDATEQRRVTDFTPALIAPVPEMGVGGRRKRVREGRADQRNGMGMAKRQKNREKGHGERKRNRRIKEGRKGSIVLENVSLIILCTGK